MALFSKNQIKSAPKKVTKVAKKAIGESVKAKDGRLETVIRAPWLSEKALIATERNVYVFATPANATAKDVKDAIELIYKVRPTKVNMVNLPAKKVSLRTKRGTGTRARRHKAYVYLKKGETIQFA